MTAFTLGEATALALGRVRPAPSGSPSGPAGTLRDPDAPRSRVRRASLEAGSFEETFFAVPAKGETDRLLRLARGALDAGRRLRRAGRIEGRALSAAERSLAALTAGAVRVYEELLTLARLNAGRVYPSYDRLAAATALGRATVARALHLLEDAGFLRRQRRFRRIGGEPSDDGQNGKKGPRYAQTSNVYRPTLPTRILGLLPRWLRPAPTPVCALQHVAEQRAHRTAMLGGLSCRELAQVTVSGALGQALAKLGARIDDFQRESHDGSGTLTQSSLLRAGRQIREEGATPIDQAPSLALCMMTDRQADQSTRRHTGWTSRLVDK